MSHLFSPIRFRELQVKNRIFVSPMCQYSAKEGLAETWHLVHLGSRAIGGAGIVFTEATAVSSEGRISPGDLGLWSDKHAEALKPITAFIKAQDSVAGVQLAHAGRKASVQAPWLGGKPVGADRGGWKVVGPSPLAFDSNHQTPQEMKEADIEKVILDFENSTRWAEKAGFQVVEIHMAHGYLLHEFLSPLSNQRSDQYGGTLENRMRLPLMIAEKVRRLWPQELPVFVRISATDWIEGGWDLEQSISFCRRLKTLSIDLIDTSTAGLAPQQKIPAAPLFQVPFAHQIKSKVDIRTGAVGLITEPQEAEMILQKGEADAIFVGRELLRNPYWPLNRAAVELAEDIKWPDQYDRAKPREHSHK